MTLFQICVVTIVTMLALSGCSERPAKAPPTEQEIHASDSGDASGTPGRHPYSCSDKRTILVDFKDAGLTLELRRDPKTAPAVLTAPAQGLQYVGDTLSAIFTGSEIKIEEGNRPAVLCRKATSQ